MRRSALFLACLCAAGLRAQELDRPGPDSGAFLLELHQVTPGPGLRDLSSRTGWGGLIGIEFGKRNLGLRVTAGVSSVPARETDPTDPSRPAYQPLVWDYGVDGLVRVGRRDLNVYGLLGVHVETWDVSSTYVAGAEGSSSGDYTHLGLRLGAGLNAGPFFAEVRYRVTGGDLSVPSDQRGTASSWSAVEAGGGLRLRF